MSAMDEPVGPDVLVMSAGLTVDQHQRGGCRQCTQDGCPQLAWAELTLAEYRQWRDVNYPIASY